MIDSFRHKSLRDLFLEGQTRGVQQSQVLHAAVVLSDMDRPGLNLHPLKGDLQGYWAVKVDGNARVIFRFAISKAEDVDLIDYRLAKAFGSTPESWLNLQTIYDLAQVREKAEALEVRQFFSPQPV